MLESIKIKFLLLENCIIVELSAGVGSQGNECALLQGEVQQVKNRFRMDWEKIKGGHLNDDDDTAEEVSIWNFYLAV